MPFTEAGGIRTRYEVIGDGPPLLMFSPGGFDSTGTAGSEDTGASVGDVGEPEPLWADVCLGEPSVDVAVVEPDEQAASRTSPRTPAASVIRRILDSFSSLTTPGVRRRG